MKWCLIDDYDVNNISGYDLSNLTLDQYYLNINVTDYETENVYLYTLNKECYECPYLITNYCKGPIEKCSKDLSRNIFGTDVTFRLATEYKEYFPQDQTENVICDISEDFGQFGIYNVDIKNKAECIVSTLKEPVNIYTPILTVILIYIALFLLIYGLYKLLRKYISKSSQSTKKSEETVSKKERVASLDVYRGLTIAVMIFANYGQGGYTTIEHARWNGLHVADLVFPSFLWIMGACIPIAKLSYDNKKTPKRDILINISKRSLKLFALGIFLNSGSDLQYLRIFGVLQRLGIGYCAASVICVFFMETGDVKEDNKKWLQYVKDIIRIYKGWMIAIGLLIIHTIIIFVVRAPGCIRGYMGPGGLHKNRSYIDCIGGATGYIDGLILGNHRYQHPTIYHTYEAKPFDPEGVIGCLTTIFHTFIGVQAGTILITYKTHSQRLIRWLLWAVITGLIGGALCGFTKEDGFIPINKSLWSISFVMATSCFSFFILSVCYVLVDVKKWWSGKPFLFAGQNAILLYILHEMCDGHFPIRWYIHNYSNITEEPRRTHFLALMSDVWATEMWILLSYYLYKIKYFFVI